MSKEDFKEFVLSETDDALCSIVDVLMQGAYLPEGDAGRENLCCKFEGGFVAGKQHPSFGFSDSVLREDVERSVRVNGLVNTMVWVAGWACGRAHRRRMLARLDEEGRENLEIKASDFEEDHA